MYLYYQMMWGSWNIKHWEALQIELLVKTSVRCGCVSLVTTEAFIHRSDGWCICGLEHVFHVWLCCQPLQPIPEMNEGWSVHPHVRGMQPATLVLVSPAPSAPGVLIHQTPSLVWVWPSISALAWSYRWEIQTGTSGLCVPNQSEEVFPRLPPRLSTNPLGPRTLALQTPGGLCLCGCLKDDGWRPPNQSPPAPICLHRAARCEAVALLPQELQARSWCAAITAFSFVLIPFPSSHHWRGVSGCDQGRCHLPSPAHPRHSWEMMPLQPAGHPSSSAAPLVVSCGLVWVETPLPFLLIPLEASLTSGG